MSADPIPAIQEQDAQGETAAIFADLRATLDVPFVNLIWRHLATMPGMLTWTWDVAKPLHRSAETRKAADLVRASVGPPDWVRQPEAVFDAVGVFADDRTRIGELIDDYSAANAMNLICLLAVQAILSGNAAGGKSSSPRDEFPQLSTRPSRKTRTAPPLPGLDELPEATRSLVMELDQFGRLAPTDAVASLYRHLAHWPGFLCVARAALSAPHHSGELRDWHLRTRDRAEALTRERVLPLAGRAASPGGADAAMALRSIETFTGHMIARMVTMGETMRALLPRA